MKAISARKTRRRFVRKGSTVWGSTWALSRLLPRLLPCTEAARPSCHRPHSVNSAPTAVSHDGCYVTISVRSCLSVGCVQQLWGGGTGILWQELMKQLNNIQRGNLNGLRGEFPLKHNATPRFMQEGATTGRADPVPPGEGVRTTRPGSSGHIARAAGRWDLGGVRPVWGPGGGVLWTEHTHLMGTISPPVGGRILSISQCAPHRPALFPPAYKRGRVPPRARGIHPPPKLAEETAAILFRAGAALRAAAKGGRGEEREGRKRAGRSRGHGESTTG